MQSINCGNNPIDYLIVFLYILEQPRKNTVYADELMILAR